ncbi:MAG: Cell-division-associated, ABC-transporter-like signaling protein FtsE, partial [uncultured Nocardioidaceae bacterium]
DHLRQGHDDLPRAAAGGSRRHLGRHRRRRVRLPRRRLGLGQVDLPAPGAARGAAGPRRRPRGGPRPQPAQGVAGPGAAPADRDGVPGLPAAAEEDRRGERRLRPAGHRRAARPGAPARPRGAGHGRAGRQGRPAPRRAVRRGAAARRDRPRRGEPPGAAHRRRADRQPRPADLRRDHEAARPHQPDRDHGPHGHPRLLGRRPDAQARHRAVRRRAGPRPGAGRLRLHPL